MINILLESIINVFWGERNDDHEEIHSNWELCGKKKKVCPEKINTDLCEHRTAVRTNYKEAYDSDEYKYQYYAEYTCTGN